MDPILHRKILSQSTDGSGKNISLSQTSPLSTHGRGAGLKRYTSLTDFAKKYKNVEPKRVSSQDDVNNEESEEGQSESESDSDSDSSDDESGREDNGIPKTRLAGRVPVVKKKKSGGLKSMFK